MTIPPQLLMMLPMLAGNLMGGSKGAQQQIPQTFNPPDLMTPLNLGQGGLMGPAGSALGMNPYYQMGLGPGLMKQFGASPSPWFGLGPIPGIMDMFG